MRFPVGTIDGPAGSGKGTVARRVAKELGFNLVEIGRFYRAVAARVIEQRLDPIEIARNFQDEDLVREDLYSPDVTDLTPTLAEMDEVRKTLEPFIRDYASRAPGSVVDGRSGMYLFPDAEVRIFLTADIKMRTFRRWEQYKRKGTERPEHQVCRELEARDARDRNRPCHPLITDEQALEAFGRFYIDSTCLNEDDTFKHVIVTFRERLNVAA